MDSNRVAGRKGARLQAVENLPVTHCKLLSDSMLCICSTCLCNGKFVHSAAIDLVVCSHQLRMFYAPLACVQLSIDVVSGMT